MEKNPCNQLASGKSIMISDKENSVTYKKKHIIFEKKKPVQNHEMFATYWQEQENPK